MYTQKFRQKLKKCLAVIVKTNLMFKLSPDIGLIILWMVGIKLRLEICKLITGFGGWGEVNPIPSGFNSSCVKKWVFR